ncbi:MAG: BMC domain-containing protein [Desulfovibrio sp.]|nr:BMC domain-containing protein [Desulfovibrio sp.]
MTRLQAVGMIEFNSIAAGIEAADAMLKAARVSPLIMKTICPGKFVAAVHSDVASAKAAVGAGLACGADTVVDHFLIPNISQSVISALSCAVEHVRGSAVGVIETFSAASSIVAADVAVKTAEVDLIEVRLAMGLGGKAICLMAGDVAAVQASVSAGAAAVAESGLLVRKVVIPGMTPELLPYIM